MPATLIWTPKSIADGCQSSEMAALLNSLFFAFTNSFLPKGPCKYKKNIKIKKSLDTVDPTHPPSKKKNMENLKSNYHEYLYMF